MSDLLIFQYYQTVTPNALLVRNTVNNLYKLFIAYRADFYLSSIIINLFSKPKKKSKNDY